MHALVYREESQLMTNNQGKSWKQSGGSSSHPSHQAQRHCTPYAHLACNPCRRLSISSFKKKIPKKRSFPVQLRSSVEGSVSSKKLGIVDEVLSSQFCLAAASRVFGQISKIKKGYKLKRSGYVCECSFRLSTVERYPVSLQSPPSGTGTSEWMKQAQMSGYPFAASSR